MKCLYFLAFLMAFTGCAQQSYRDASLNASESPAKQEIVQKMEWMQRHGGDEMGLMYGR